MKKHDILIQNNERKAKEYIESLEEKKPLFLCVIATTETAKIPGISAAGKYPEFTDYTPPADAELIYFGKCKCIDAVPATPEGIPTPALITMSALKLVSIPAFVVDAGCRVKPHAPFIGLGGFPGADIRTGRAVNNVDEVLRRAESAGKQFSKTADYLVIGESIPGGTTTALALLLALGIDAKGKVSSSMPNNPHDLKAQVAEEAMRAAGIRFGELHSEPLKAIAHVGDPMMPALAGLILGASEVPILMAGGTQMAAVLAILTALKPEVLRNIVLATTKWILQDKSSDLVGITRQIFDIPILGADLNFGISSNAGLRAYEEGVVKEGVGAGGASIAAMLKSGGSVDRENLLREIDESYARLVGHRS